jgi:hypothetical protein
MIEPRLDDEIKVEIHGYFYARREDLVEIGYAYTAANQLLAEEGKLHNVIMRCTPVTWEEKDIPIFENEEDRPDEIDDETRLKRLCVLESLDLLNRYRDIAMRYIYWHVRSRVMGCDETGEG